MACFVFVLGVIVLVNSHGAGADTTEITPTGNMTEAEVAEFAEYRLYSAGDSTTAGGRTIELNAAQRELAPERPAQPVQEDYVAFMYGTCTVYIASEEEGDENSGCSLPLEIQVWPACQRNPSVYDEEDRADATTIRGVPAWYHEDGTRLEISTSDVTVVIFGDSRQEVSAAANYLVLENERPFPKPKPQPLRPPGDNDPPWPPFLPAPVPGAVEGTLQCQ